MQALRKPHVPLYCKRLRHYRATTGWPRQWARDRRCHTEARIWQSCTYCWGHRIIFLVMEWVCLASACVDRPPFNWHAHEFFACYNGQNVRVESNLAKWGSPQVVSHSIDVPS